MIASPKSGTRSPKWWKTETKISACTGIEGLFKSESKRKYGVLRKTELFFKWFTSSEITGSSLMQRWKLKPASKSENATSTNSTPPSREKSGLRQKISKSLSSTQNMDRDGPKSVRACLEDPKTESRTDSTLTFRKTTTSWLRMKQLTLMNSRLINHMKTSLWWFKIGTCIPTLFTFQEWLSRENNHKVMNLLMKTRKIENHLMKIGTGNDLYRK